MNKNKLFQSVFIKCVSLVMLLPGFVIGAINVSVQPRLEIGEPLPSAALGLPQLGSGAELVEGERLSSTELSEADNASLGQAMSRARRKIRRLTELQSEQEQNSDTHFLASNPGQNLGVRFTSNGARIKSKLKDRDWQADFRLARRPPTTEVAVNGTRMEYSYGSIIEWYDNRSDGIEHGFILKERPADAGGDLKLKIVLTGLKARAGQSGTSALDLVDADGEPVLSYGKLKVWDAKGVELKSSLTVQYDDIVITVADAGAQYPVTIDPLITSQEAKLMPSGATPSDFFGCAVSLSGNRAIVGAYGDDDNGSRSGSAYVFVCSNGVWTEEQKLVANDGEELDYFGHSVSLSSDRVIVGAYGDDDKGSGSGSAYVFVYSNGAWTLEQKLTAIDGAAYGSFGKSVSLSDDRVIVGATVDVGAGNYSGSAYVFVYSNGVWSTERKLTDVGGENGDNFGIAVSLSGDTAIVGALGNHNDAVGYGSAYVYVRSNGAWTLEQKLKAGDGKAYDKFGSSLSLSGDSVIVSAYENNGTGSYSGSAYIFVSSNGVWTQEAKLTDGGESIGGYFGASVSISGDRAIVGDRDDGANNNEFGSAYLFVRDRGVWMQWKKLTAGDRTVGAMFGGAVSISGDREIVGAYSGYAGEIRSGSAYIYALRPPSPNDYDGDGASDLAVLDQGTGRWFIRTVAGNQLGFSINWGWPGVEGVAGDYNGDGSADLAVFDQGTGRWFVRALSGSTIVWENFWGWSGVRPVAGDYDGDGIYDLAILDQVTGRWFIKKTDNTILGWSLNWGWAGVEPVSGDYDGDGLADLAVFDQNTGRWFIRAVSGTQIAFDVNWGWPGVDPVAGDYDGDGKDDLAIFDQASGRWFIRAVDGTQLGWNINWGWPGVLPVSGDFNGDGADDLAIFDEATGRWFIRTLSGTTIAWDVNWGWPGVQPIGR